MRKLHLAIVLSCLAAGIAAAISIANLVIQTQQTNDILDSIEALSEAPTEASAPTTPAATQNNETQNNDSSSTYSNSTTSQTNSRNTSIQTFTSRALAPLPKGTFAVGTNSANPQDASGTLYAYAYGERTTIPRSSLQGGTADVVMLHVVESSNEEALIEYYGPSERPGEVTDFVLGCYDSDNGMIGWDVASDGAGVESKTLSATQAERILDATAEHPVQLKLVAPKASFGTDLVTCLSQFSSVEIIE